MISTILKRGWSDEGDHNRVLNREYGQLPVSLRKGSTHSKNSGVSGLFLMGPNFDEGVFLG